MIDTHSHILPGLDDGAKTMTDALGIIRQLHEAGFTTLVATPHVLEGTDYLHPAEILAMTDQVRRQVTEAGIPVEIVAGAENYIFPDMAKWAREGKLLTLGNTGKYLLVELPMLEIPHYTDKVFFELQVQGLTPILAHPERYKGLTKEPERLLAWAKKGVLFQLDLRSLDGKYGPQANRLATIMLNSDLIHMIGSDAHRVSSSIATYPETLQIIQEILGEEGFREVTQRNPRRILAGKEVPGREEYGLKEPGLKKKGFWNWVRGLGRV